VAAWGERKATRILGGSPQMLEAQRKLLQCAQTDSPVLITGETGTGKDLFARSLYLLSARRGKPFLSVNCAQYADGQLIASELFGHRRGSFTGAVADHRGVFETADGGVVFLDEVGELTLAAQAMLLRVLGEGEIVPVGETRARPVNVRTIAATSRDLPAMIARGEFREDLFYRLRFLQIRVPALRERENDWRLMVEHHLSQQGGHVPGRRLSPRAWSRLERYGWPGNVRELRGLMQTGCALATGDWIEPEDFAEVLEELPVAAMPRAEVAGAYAVQPPHAAPPAPEEADSLARMREGEVSFWDAVYSPFMEREMNRAEVRDLLARALACTRGSYKGLLPHFGLEADEYLKFMDFLRHHRLKPERF